MGKRGKKRLLEFRQLYLSSEHFRTSRTCLPPNFAETHPDESQLRRPPGPIAKRPGAFWSSTTNDPNTTDFRSARTPRRKHQREPTSTPETNNSPPVRTRRSGATEPVRDPEAAPETRPGDTQVIPQGIPRRFPERCLKGAHVWAIADTGTASAEASPTNPVAAC